MYCLSHFTMIFHNLLALCRANWPLKAASVVGSVAPSYVTPGPVLGTLGVRVVGMVDRGPQGVQFQLPCIGIRGEFIPCSSLQKGKQQ